MRRRCSYGSEQHALVPPNGRGGRKPSACVHTDRDTTIMTSSHTLFQTRSGFQQLACFVKEEIQQISRTVPTAPISRSKQQALA